jgi:hypothetical protein
MVCKSTCDSLFGFILFTFVNQGQSEAFVGDFPVDNFCRYMQPNSWLESAVLAAIKLNFMLTPNGIKVRSTNSHNTHSCAHDLYSIEKSKKLNKQIDSRQTCSKGFTKILKIFGS